MVPSKDNVTLLTGAGANLLDILMGGRIINSALLPGTAKTISGVCSLTEPHEGAISFLTNPSPASIWQYQNLPLGALLVPAKWFKSEESVIAEGSERLNKSLEQFSSFTLIAVEDPHRSLIQLIPHFYSAPEASFTVHSHAVVHETAILGSGVRVGPFAVIEAGCIVGDNTIIHPHVVLYPNVKLGRGCVIHSGVAIRENCTIGDNAIIQNGVVVGSDGFGYLPDPQVGLMAVPQIGTVIVGSGVDIGANSCIDRATLGTTKIGAGTKIDNLVQIGHNNHIGSFSILCGQVGIAGSCTIGDQVVLGGSTKVKDHVTIASGVRIGGAGTVLRSITEKGDYAGEGPLPKRQWLKRQALLEKLPSLLGSNLRKKSEKQ